MYSYFVSGGISTNLVVQFLREGNAIMGSQGPKNRAADCAPCADSELTLKEQIAKLDDMELLDDNEDESEETPDVE